MEYVFEDNFKSLDYIACWFFKSKKYIENTNAESAFVTTNSICQGLQVALLWKRILNDNIEISFAYTSFKWSNNAKHNAAVTVVIVGLTSHKRCKYLFVEGNCLKVENITAYLFPGNNIFIESAFKPLCKDVPVMNFGNMPADGGLLLFTTEEKKVFIEKEPQSVQYFRQIYGSEEFINGKERWCLWLYGHNPEEFNEMPLIRERINQLREIRLRSSRPQLAEIPHLFAQITQPLGVHFVIIPSVSSELREYIPMGYLDCSKLATNLCMVIGTDDISLFGILTSKMHMAWVKTIGGRLETRYRYSAQLCYNTFPFPSINDAQREELGALAQEVIDVRDQHYEIALGELYNPESMPEDLKEVHHRLDLAVDSCYRPEPFASDEERLECLFKLYAKMNKK